MTPQRQNQKQKEKQNQRQGQQQGQRPHIELAKGASSMWGTLDRFPSGVASPKMDAEEEAG
jgi:hypothetical protein